MLKPFDKVLVRNGAMCVWIPALFGKKMGDCYLTSAGWQQECLRYEGNEDLLGTKQSSKRTKIMQKRRL